MKKMLTTQFLALGLIGAAGSAMAYQAEVGGAIGSDTLGFGGVFHVNGVEAASGPLSEAAFLDQSTFVGASYTQVDGDGFGDAATTSLH